MADEQNSAAAAPKKSKLGLVIGAVFALVTLVGGSVAGAVLGPKLMGTAPPVEGAADGEPRAEGAAPKPALAPVKVVPVEFPSLVVDLRDEEGRVRHLKVGLIAELPETVTVDEFKLVMPRGREASLSYFRSLTFEEVSDPKQYEKIKAELSKRVTEAVGADRVHRILLVDFVSQ
jgi:flagellar basal body-associated protein FliL